MTSPGGPPAPTDQFRLDGKVAVVTGGSRGIGRAMAEGLAAAGADVVIASRKLEACRTAASEIARATGRATHAVACHVGRWSDCDALADEVYGRFGRCDILVNNAGMSPLYDSLDTVSEEYYDKVSAVNLKGPFRLSSNLGRRMFDAGSGSIINVSTVGALRPGSTELVYCCAKAGLNALTIGLAEAYGPRVRTNCIMPGGVLTDVATAWTDEMCEHAKSNLPMARLGTPADFVGTAVWLASEASAWVTGVLLRVDGGAYRQTS
jgi:NAD(P)-dependent dehydrogenase (short-subunit alcohol dehydrogenase family)